MSSWFKGIMWGLTLVTVAVVSMQYAPILRGPTPDASLHHDTPDPAYRLVQVGSQTMRLNSGTGETHYWNDDAGGWVEVRETGLISSVSKEERQKRETIIAGWLRIHEEAFRGLPFQSYEEASQMHMGTPSWKLAENLEAWKRKGREWLTDSWYQITDEEYRQNMPRNKFKDHMKTYTLAQLRRGYDRRKSQNERTLVREPILVPFE